MPAYDGGNCEEIDEYLLTVKGVIDVREAQGVSVMYTHRVPLEAEVAGPYLSSEVHLTTKGNQVLKLLNLSMTKPFLMQVISTQRETIILLLVTAVEGNN